MQKFNMMRQMGMMGQNRDGHRPGPHPRPMPRPFPRPFPKKKMGKPVSQSSSLDLSSATGPNIPIIFNAVGMVNYLINWTSEGSFFVQTQDENIGFLIPPGTPFVSSNNQPASLVDIQNGMRVSVDYSVLSTVIVIKLITIL